MNGKPVAKVPDEIRTRYSQRFAVRPLSVLSMKSGADLGGGGDDRGARRRRPAAVYYTHLTLPTIYSV